MVRDEYHLDRLVYAVPFRGYGPMNRVSSVVSMVGVGGVVLAFANPSAWAYPTSVVFAPSGESKGPGELGAFLYGSLSLAPSVSAGSTWYGFNVGLLPKVAYGVGDLTFGGMEVGVDALSTDLAGTPSAFVKTVFNAKAQLIVEQSVGPSFAVRVLGLHPFRTERSINMIYGTMTKALGE